MSKQKKIQDLLIKHLSDEGQIQLLLPDGMILELGITQEDKHGNLIKTDDYSWAIVTQKGRDVSIDSYSQGLRFEDDPKKLIFEDSYITDDGEARRLLSVV